MAKKALGTFCSFAIRIICASLWKFRDTAFFNIVVMVLINGSTNYLLFGSVLRYLVPELSPHFSFTVDMVQPNNQLLHSVTAELLIWPGWKTTLEDKPLHATVQPLTTHYQVHILCLWIASTLMIQVRTCALSST